MNIAIIPVKVWGSKGLPNKFCMNMAGRELWEWVTIAANDCKYIDQIYMTGNKKEYKEFYPKVKLMYPKVKWITRPESLQKNGVELLEVMQYCQKKIGKKGDVFIQLQATKPMTTAKLLNEILEFYNEKRAEIYEYNYSESNKLKWIKVNNLLNTLFTVQKINTAVNWEYKASRQEGKENFKSCSVVKIWDYETLKNAKKGTWGFGKNHYNYEIDQRHIEIDDELDFRIAEALKKAGL